MRSQTLFFGLIFLLATLATTTTIAQYIGAQDGWSSMDGAINGGSSGSSSSSSGGGGSSSSSSASNDDLDYYAMLANILNNNGRRFSAVSNEKRACIRRGGPCDHRPNDCCPKSSCRCNLWGTNCRCNRLGLFQKWGKKR